MNKVIQCDTRQKMNQKHHRMKEEYFKSQGYTLVHSKMLAGDYSIPSNGSVSVDTKQSLTELYGNLITDHARFHNECVLAQQCGIKLYIVVECKENYTSIDDIKNWKNPQMFRYYKEKRKAEHLGIKPPKPPASNVQLIKIMHSMTRDYGVEFVFVPQQLSGKKIIEILTRDNHHTS